MERVCIFEICVRCGSLRRQYKQQRVFVSIVTIHKGAGKKSNRQNIIISVNEEDIRTKCIQRYFFGDTHTVEI